MSGPRRGWLAMAAQEAGAIARGEKPAAAVWFDGHRYVPADALTALQAETARLQAQVKALAGALRDISEARGMDGVSHAEDAQWACQHAGRLLESLDLTEPPEMRCAECTCENGDGDCNWIVMPTLAALDSNPVTQEDQTDG